MEIYQRLHRTIVVKRDLGPSLSRVSGLRDEEWSSSIQEELGVEPLLFWKEPAELVWASDTQGDPEVSVGITYPIWSKNTLVPRRRRCKAFLLKEISRVPLACGHHNLSLISGEHIYIYIYILMDEANKTLTGLYTITSWIIPELEDILGTKRPVHFTIYKIIFCYLIHKYR